MIVGRRLDEDLKALTPTHPALEYGKTSRLDIASWLGLAGFHYLGSAIFACATIIVGTLATTSDPEAIVYLPISLVTYAGLLIVPASIIWLALLAGAALLHRSSPKGARWKGFLIGGTTACSALLIDHFAMADDFSDDHPWLSVLFYAGFLVALPVASYFLMSRREPATLK